MKDELRDTRRRLLLRATAGACAALAGLSFGPRAGASRGDTLRFLCSGPGGRVPDRVARTVADQLLAAAGRRALVDNRPGAAWLISVSALKNAEADGLTLLLAQGAIASLYPNLYPKLAYDPDTDLAPVSAAGEMTLALAVGPAVPPAVADVRELLAWLRANPAQAHLGSPGIGTLPHLLQARLMREAGVAWQHVVYGGGPPALVALLGGQIAALVLPEGLLSPHRAAGRLRVLATSGARRTDLMPDVPTLAEQGFAELVVREWFGFFMSGRVAAPQVEAASTLLGTALAQPGLQSAFDSAGMVAVSSTPAAMRARIAAERLLWKPVLQALAVRVE